MLDREYGVTEFIWLRGLRQARSNWGHRQWIKLRDLEERKIKAEETRKLQIEEVKKTQEITKENLKEIEERKSKELQQQEKIDPS